MLRFVEPVTRSGYSVELTKVLGDNRHWLGKVLRRVAMTVPPPDHREEDPLFLERQRSRYASRGVAFLVILNGVAALLLLNNFLGLHPQVEHASKVARMVVFGVGGLRPSPACFLPIFGERLNCGRLNALLRDPSGGGLPCLLPLQVRYASWPAYAWSARPWLPLL